MCLAQPLEPWEEFELAVSEILHDNDFDFFYQFEVPLAKPDINGKTKRILDYVAVFKGLYLVLDSKAWKDPNPFEYGDWQSYFESFREIQG